MSGRRIFATNERIKKVHSTKNATSIPNTNDPNQSPSGRSRRSCATFLKLIAMIAKLQPKVPKNQDRTCLVNEESHRPKCQPANLVQQPHKKTTAKGITFRWIFATEGHAARNKATRNVAIRICEILNCIETSLLLFDQAG